MCGICGLFDFKNRAIKETLDAMTDALQHRGPDDRGTLIERTNTGCLGLGHRRLSIIDLSPLGRQPFESISGNACITYNGEVYNYQTIRQELMSLGQKFKSQTDTEVILQAYEHWGLKAINRFLGMFAFSIYDRKTQSLHLVRDRIGVKPLYYYWHNGLLLFSSELKSFHCHPVFERRLNMDSVGLFLRYGYIPSPATIFENVYKLPPGHILSIDLVSRQFYLRKYWDVVDAYNLPKRTISFEDAEAELESLMKDAFRLRLISDVPVGVFLSGGVDSSAVVALLQSVRSQPLKTYTIGFSETTYDESESARQIAGFLGTDHHEYRCTSDEARSIIPELANYFDEPFGDSSAIPTLLVSRFAAKSVKVILSGDGGDEIYGGYENYLYNPYYQKIFEVHPALKYAGSKLLQVLVFALNNMRFVSGLLHDPAFEAKLQVVNEVLIRNSLPGFARAMVESNFNSMTQIKRLLKHDPYRLRTAFYDSGLLKKTNTVQDIMMALDLKTYLSDDILCKVDRATMAASLEGREPHLDHRLVEYAATLPTSFKIKKNLCKRILKKILYKHIPANMMERPKHGFGIPVDVWLRKELRYLLDEYLDPSLVHAQGCFNSVEISAIKQQFLAGKPINFNRIWFLLMFQMWYARWMKKT